MILERCAAILKRFVTVSLVALIFVVATDAPNRLR